MNIEFLIFCLFLVTFIPRVLPSVLMDKLNYSRKFEKFLKLLTYTSLAALICPGVLNVDPNYWFVGLFGAIVAAILAWKKVNMGLIVIITVIALVCFYQIIPFII